MQKGHGLGFAAEHVEPAFLFDVPDCAIALPSHLENLLYNAMLWPTTLQEQEMSPLSKPQAHEVCQSPSLFRSIR
jgi:hypothetical protein